MCMWASVRARVVYVCVCVCVCMRVYLKVLQPCVLVCVFKRFIASISLFESPDFSRHVSYCVLVFRIMVQYTQTCTLCTINTIKIYDFGFRFHDLLL